MAESDDLRQFIRDMNIRADKRNDAMIRRLDAQTAEMHEQATAMREHATAMRNMGDQIRANTEGLLRVLDELRGPA